MPDSLMMNVAKIILIKQFKTNIKVVSKIFLI